jgi:hypothetical protein
MTVPRFFVGDTVYCWDLLYNGVCSPATVLSLNVVPVVESGSGTGYCLYTVKPHDRHNGDILFSSESRTMSYAEVFAYRLTGKFRHGNSLVVH